jgi:hypothetical protein
MDVQYLIQLLQNKITILNNAKSQAFSVGDLDRINSIDKDIMDTQNTLAQLNTLANLANATAVTNMTPAEVIASGVDAIQTAATTQGPSASAVINGYDLSAYATDASYEDKIRTILRGMPTFTVVGDIDNYIQNAAPGSPVTGNMVYAAANQYNVDLSLLLAIIQNDSDFGTLGIGARTFNPGNIGNTGTSTQAFPSWNDGVTAVANWLNNHRVIDPTTISPVDVQTDATSTPSTAATSTPAVILPTTPIVAATTTPTTTATSTNPLPTPIITAPATTTPPIIPIVNATTTATTTDTSTPPMATTTPPTDASSTPPLDGPPLIPPIATSTDSVGTSTPPSDASSTPPVNDATTTPPIAGPIIDASSTPPADATSTPDQNASSTQAVRKLRVKRA